MNQKLASLALALILAALVTTSAAARTISHLPDTQATFDRHAIDGRGFVAPQIEAPRVIRRVHHKRERLKDRPAIPTNHAGGTLVEKARSYIGQTAGQIGVRRSLWCSAFLRAITNADGVDDRAKSWLAKPRVAPQVGAIAVLSRGSGGHVGVVSGFDGRGNPIIISGNHGHRVGEGVYSASRVIAYVSGG